MKKLICVIFAVALVVFAALSLTKNDNSNYDYLRIHIRANSNSELDQSVKYKVKDKIVAYLTPQLYDVPSKAEAVKVVEREKHNLEKIGRDELNLNGFDYSVRVKINNEFFPTRTYSNTTLESGFYDAVIVELGSAEGDNWWCVMYPPLCFVANGEKSEKITFKSRIAEWWNKLIKK